MIMLARIAESLYWLGRLTERAESTSRMLEVQHYASLEAEETGLSSWEPILAVLGQLTSFKEEYEYASSENVIDYMVFGVRNPSSVVECIKQARENARGSREMIPQELWRILNVTFHEIVNFNMDLVRREGPDKFFNFIKEKGYLIQGVINSTMFRGLGYQFLQAGKYMERADQTARILDVKAKYLSYSGSISAKEETLDIYRWKTLLNSVGSYEAYVKTYGTKIDPTHVSELLIFDTFLPRSLLFCIERTKIAISEITIEKEKYYSNRMEQMLGKLFHQLAYSSIDEVLNTGLHEFLSKFISEISNITFEMNYSYFGSTKS